MHYADSSFVVSFIVQDAMTEMVRSTYRRLGRPRLIFGPFHQMEVANAMRLLCFQESRQLPVKQRAQAELRFRRSEARLLALQQNHTLSVTGADWSAVMMRFSLLSEVHTIALGVRSLDILHVAFALELRCDHFVTCDQRQYALAKAAGLKAALVSP
jgi:predicted nucleic acid-binding protein